MENVASQVAVYNRIWRLVLHLFPDYLIDSSTVLLHNIEVKGLFIMRLAGRLACLVRSHFTPVGRITFPCIYSIILAKTVGIPASRMPYEQFGWKGG